LAKRTNNNLLHIRIDDETMERLCEACEVFHLSISETVRRILSRNLTEILVEWEMESAKQVRTTNVKRLLSFKQWDETVAEAAQQLANVVKTNKTRKRAVLE